MKRYLLLILIIPTFIYTNKNNEQNRSILSNSIKIKNNLDPINQSQFHFLVSEMLSPHLKTKKQEIKRVIDSRLIISPVESSLPALSLFFQYLEQYPFSKTKNMKIYIRHLKQKKKELEQQQ